LILDTRFHVIELFENEPVCLVKNTQLKILNIYLSIRILSSRILKVCLSCNYRWWTNSNYWKRCSFDAIANRQTNYVFYMTLLMV